jgi:hypothetical protein
MQIRPPRSEKELSEKLLASVGVTLADDAVIQRHSRVLTIKEVYKHTNSEDEVFLAYSFEEISIPLPSKMLWGYAFKVGEEIEINYAGEWISAYFYGYNFHPGDYRHYVVARTLNCDAEFTASVQKKKKPKEMDMFEIETILGYPVKLI